jgi:hypothetical protein
MESGKQNNSEHRWWRCGGSGRTGGCGGGETDFDGGSFLLFCSDLLLSLLPMFLVCFVSETVFVYFIFLLVWLLLKIQNNNSLSSSYFFFLFFSQD